MGGSRATRSGEDAKQPRFKGFHNAFVAAEPVMTQSMVSGKEGNTEESQRRDPFLTPMKSNAPRNVDNRDSGDGKWKEKGGEVDEEDFPIDWLEGDGRGREVGYKRETMVAVDREEGRGFPMQSDSELGEEDTIIEESVDWGEEVSLFLSGEHNSFSGLHS